ncbi:pinin-like [Oncorhynchus mykiss]|uniref:pinin-like n=1 Tax=Oncorhynchus mykiss TaxID=8022 RepID=UPI0018781F0F|nr:pinin-like [Oncorhynchus mykiss]
MYDSHSLVMSSTLMNYLAGVSSQIFGQISLTNRPGERRRMTGVLILTFCLLGAALTSSVPQYDVTDELPPQREMSEQVVQYGTLDQFPLQREMVPQVSQTDILDQMIPPQLNPQVTVLPQVPGNQVDHTPPWNSSSSPQQVSDLPQLPGNQVDHTPPWNSSSSPQQISDLPQLPGNQTTSSSESQSSDQSHSSESSPEDTSEDTTSEDIQSLSSSNSSSSSDSRSSSSSSDSRSSSSSSDSRSSSSSMPQDRTGVNLDGDTQDDSHGSEENQRRNWLAAFTHYQRRSRLTVMGGATSRVGAAGGVRCLTAGCRGDTVCHSNELTFDLGDDAPGNQYSNQHGDDMIMWPDQEETRGERELGLGLKK